MQTPRSQADSQENFAKAVAGFPRHESEARKRRRARRENAADVARRARDRRARRGAMSSQLAPADILCCRRIRGGKRWESGDMMRTAVVGIFLALAALTPAQQAAAQDPVGGAI